MSTTEQAEPGDDVPTPQDSQSGAIAALLLALAGLAVFAYTYEPFARGEFYSHLDTKAQLIPWRCSQSIALERGELGLWNPYMSRGYPHHAEGQSGILHPCHIIGYGLLPVEWALALEMSLYMPFAFLGMFLFIRMGLKSPPLPALVAGGIFTFSSFMSLHFMHVNMLWVHAHLPWALLALNQVYASERPHRWAVGLGVCFASMILLGHPQLVWMNALGVAGLALLRAVQTRLSRHVVRRSLLAGTVLGGALLIGMVQILPTAAYLARSQRKKVTQADFDNYSLPPINLALSMSPYMLNNRFVADDVVGSNTKEFIPSLEFPNYFGVLCLSLLLFYCVYDRRRLFGESRNTTGVALGFLLILTLLTIGKYGGIIQLQRLLPLVSQFRCPVRYASLVFALLACLAAAAISRLSTMRDRNLRDLMWASGIPVALSLVLTVIVRLTQIGVPKPHLKIGTRLGAGYGPLAATVGVCVLALAIHKKSQFIWCVFGILMLADVACYNEPLLHSMVRRTFIGVNATRRAMVTEDHTYRHYAGVNDPVLDGHYIANGYLGIKPPQTLVYYGKGMDVNHIRLASIAVGHFQNNGTPQEIRIPNPLPRARLVPNLEITGDPITTNHDPTKSALTNAQAGLSGPPLESGETAEIVDDGFDRIRIKTVAKHPRLLVLSDRWWPYWEATIDGTPKPIIPLYGHAMRGVIVGPGEHVVEMRYISRPLQWGVWCAVVGVLILIGSRFIPMANQSSPKEMVSKTS